MTRNPPTDDECVVEIHDPSVPGKRLCCPTWPQECSYVRVINARNEEIGYWTADELKDAPAEVLGAIIGALAGNGKKV